jgi:hypothetical protein
MRFKNAKKIGCWDYDENIIEYEVHTNKGTPVKVWKHKYYNKKKAKKSSDKNSLYWCHGYIFGKSKYSPYDNSVEQILEDEWIKIRENNAREGDILVWYDYEYENNKKIKYIAHSGRIISKSFTNNNKLHKCHTKIANKHGLHDLFLKERLKMTCKNYGYDYYCYRRRKQ